MHLLILTQTMCFFFFFLFFMPEPNQPQLSAWLKSQKLWTMLVWMEPSENVSPLLATFDKLTTFFFLSHSSCVYHYSKHVHISHCKDKHGLKKCSNVLWCSLIATTIFRICSKSDKNITNWKDPTCGRVSQPDSLDIIIIIIIINSLIANQFVYICIDMKMHLPVLSFFSFVDIYSIYNHHITSSRFIVLYIVNLINCIF